jgi:uncharacterized protein
MKIEDSFTLPGPIETVWQFLLDIERMARCIPGVETIEAEDDQTYRGRLKVKVGPIAAAFEGTVTIVELDAPTRIVARIAADDQGSASAVRADFTSNLRPVEAGTQVDFAVEFNLRGRLAQFGLAVVKGTARKMTAQFSQCVRQALEAGAAHEL